MRRLIKLTADGSQTLYVPELDEHYHSIHGAYTESMHVFINKGLHPMLQNAGGQLSILEIGLGTGLNALLSLSESAACSKKIFYTALEPFPLDPTIISQLHYDPLFSGTEIKAWFKAIHDNNFDTITMISPGFSFIKYQQRLEDIIFNTTFDVVYFDAFGPRVQNEIWCAANFHKLYSVMRKDGVLVTYCSKGDVRRNMLAAGFVVEKLPGPPGKREMLRAKKTI